MAGSPVPTSELELIPWLTNFGAKFANYGPSLGFNVPEVEQTQREIDYLVYLLNVRVPAERQTLNATLEYKNLMKDGLALDPLPNVLPGNTPPPDYPAAVLPGILGRLRKLVQNIKTRPGYTAMIGEDLAILGGVVIQYPDAPTLSLTSPVAGAVTLNWNKGGWTGVKLQTRVNGSWVDLGVDHHSPYVDTRPLAIPAQPEGREYRACYVDGDAFLPSFSPVLEVTVKP